MGGGIIRRRSTGKRLTALHRLASRWATYGVVELDKELQHLRRAMPASAATPNLERYLDERRAEVERVYGGNRIAAR